MATLFHHQRNKAKGFGDGSEFHARPIRLRIGSAEFDYVSLFHLVSFGLSA
jgi:hypothetical protein